MGARVSQKFSLPKFSQRKTRQLAIDSYRSRRRTFGRTVAEQEFPGYGPSFSTRCSRGTSSSGHPEIRARPYQSVVPATSAQRKSAAPRAMDRDVATALADNPSSSFAVAYYRSTGDDIGDAAVTEDLILRH